MGTLFRRGTTGGTAKVAEVITQAWGMPVTKIDLSNAETDY